MSRMQLCRRRSRASRLAGFAARFKSLGLCHHLTTRWGHRKRTSVLRGGQSKVSQASHDSLLCCLILSVVTVFHRAVARCVHHALDHLPSEGLRKPADGDFEITCGQAGIPRTLRMSNTPGYRYRIAQCPILGLDWRIGRYSD
jgi:hypothetical protein